MRTRVWMSLTVIFMLMASCNLPTKNTALPAATPVAIGVDVVGTSVELTTVARIAELAGSAVPPPVVAPPTIIVPTNTPVQIPCNKASFVEDVNYPDGTKVDTDSNFTKIWRLKNNGSCTWTSGYSVIFDHGDRMGASDWIQLTSGTVPPGSTVDVSINFKAPSSTGTYQGFFKLKAADGPIFGINANGQDAFWVKVTVKKKAAADADLPDLTASGMQFSPNPGRKNQPVSIQVKVTNDGAAPAGQFTVLWLSNQTKPGCDWTVTSLGIGKSKDLECEFTYTYKPAATSTFWVTLEVDPENQVEESDESNNSRDVQFKVIP